MMSIAHLLEDFGAHSRGQPMMMTDLLLEEIRLEAYESGFKAGWEDADKDHAQDVRQISAELAGNLRDLSFTYHEACAGLMAGLQPVLRGMVDTVLPEIARASLGVWVVEQLADLAREGLQKPIHIVCAPTNMQALDALLPEYDDPPVVLSAEPSLSEGQVYFRFGGTEYEINLDSVLAEISTAMSGFMSQTDKKESA